MRILLTNDDGFDAPGINVLADELEKNGYEIIIAAPDTEQSATSHAITLNKPIRIIERGKDRYAISGTPADCISLAFQVLVKKPVDLVISGINAGQNMGEDLLYSGTVAAALEAMFLGYRSIAVSLTSYTDQRFKTAAHYMKKLLQNNVYELIVGHEILNINIPNVEIPEVTGIKITKLGHRHYQDFVKERIDAEGRKTYFIGGDIPHWSYEKDTDAAAVLDKYISITPVFPDFTKRDSFDKLITWKNKMINFLEK